MLTSFDFELVVRIANLILTGSLCNSSVIEKQKVTSRLHHQGEDFYGMKKLSFTKKLTAAFGLAFAVIAINTVISYSNSSRLIDYQHSLTQSLQALVQLESTKTAYINTEIAKRDYLITGKQNYLNTYLSGVEETNINLRHLQALTFNYSTSEKYITLLNNQITNSFKIFAREVELKNQANSTYGEVMLSSNSKVVNDIEQLIQKIAAAEQKLLQQRLNESQISFHYLTTFSIATFGDVGLVGLLYLLLRSYIIRLKLTEQRLVKSENRLQTIVDATECISLIATDGTLLEINASGIAIMAVQTAQELVGKPLNALIASEYQEAFAALHTDVCQGKRGFLEFEIINHQGERRWIETHAIPLSEANTTFLHLALMRDITEKKLAQHQINQQAALLDAAVDAILVQDMQLKIQYWNQGAERLYGWSAKEVVGKNTSYLLYQASQQLEAALASTIKYGTWQGELKQVRCDDREIIVESRWTLLRDSSGEPKSILTVNTDITQRKQLSMQLMRSQRLESIGTLAGGIAHDLNNVLSPILMSVQLLQMKLRDNEHQQLLKMLENNVKRGASLVKQILSFASGMENKRIVIDLKQVIAEIEQIITETFPKSIACQIELPAQLNHVCGDTTQIHQVLMNLVVNARDAMPDGGKLSISAKHFVDNNTSDNYIIITVTDTGMGIPQHIQKHIFEPFFTTKGIGKGTGLGLSTTLAIVKNHGGFVKLDSEVTKGTSFQIFLPALQTCEPLKNEPEVGFITGRGELILVVDDEENIRKITQSTLEACNYRVLTAGDGVEAVTIYAKYQHDISVVLLDMMMPTMDGAIAIRTLQKINPKVKIIALSGLLPSHKVHPTNMGVEALISKPCTAKELLQTISMVNRSWELGVRS